MNIELFFPNSHSFLTMVILYCNAHAKVQQYSTNFLSIPKPFENSGFIKAISFLKK